jgi:hypothetical protein
MVKNLILSTPVAIMDPNQEEPTTHRRHMRIRHTGDLNEEPHLEGTADQMGVNVAKEGPAFVSGLPHPLSSSLLPPPIRLSSSLSLHLSSPPLRWKSLR